MMPAHNVKNLENLSLLFLALSLLLWGGGGVYTMQALVAAVRRWWFTCVELNGFNGRCHQHESLLKRNDTFSSFGADANHLQNWKQSLPQKTCKACWQLSSAAQCSVFRSAPVWVSRKDVAGEISLH